MKGTTIVDSNIDKLVTKSNILIEANYKLGAIEQKIILCLASNIQPSDADFKTYTLPIKEFNELLGLKGNHKYTGETNAAEARRQNQQAQSRKSQNAGQFGQS